MGNAIETTAESAEGQLRDTAIGAVAVLLWSTLALLTTLSGKTPPFQLVSMAFSVAFLIGVLLWWKQGVSPLRDIRLPWRVWMLGIGGLFGYHFLYFLALRNAPAVEANLINYLWPLLIVLLSSFLPGERLRWYHLLGALAGLAGALMLISDGQGVGISKEYTFGYLAAIGSALTWAIYSVLSRRFGQVPTHAVGAFCGITAVLSALCHLWFEVTVWPQSFEWVAIFLLGLGPVGGAFFVWDHGVKRGNIKTLGAFAYMAPLVSTLLLVMTGRAEPSWILLYACLLIVGGALIAAGDLIKIKSWPGSD